MKATIPIGIQPGTKLLRIERVPPVPYIMNTHYYGLRDDSHNGQWLIWIHHNPDFTLGTYLTLHQDGRVENTTVHEDGTETVFQVKGPDE